MKGYLLMLSEDCRPPEDYWLAFSKDEMLAKIAAWPDQEREWREQYRRKHRCVDAPGYEAEERSYDQKQAEDLAKFIDAHWTDDPGWHCWAEQSNDSGVYPPPCLFVFEVP